MVQHLKHGRTVLITLSAGALHVAVLAGNVAVGEVDIGNVVNNLAVGLLGHPLVEATVTSLHVEYGDVPFFGRDGAQAAVGIAQHQHGIGIDGLEQWVNLNEYLANGGRGAIAGGIEVVVGWAYAHIIVKNLVQLVVVVLPGMDVICSMAGLWSGWPLHATGGLSRDAYQQR